MAGLGIKQTIWDSPQDKSSSSSLDEWAKSPERGGQLRLNTKDDQAYVERAIGGILSGQISDEGAMNLAKRVKGIAPHVLSALEQRKAMAKSQAEYGQYFDPGKPATPDRPFTEADQGTGVGPYRAGQPIMGTATPEIAPKVDYDRAIAHATKAGNIELAQKYQVLKEKNRSLNKTGLYGGIQYAWDPKTKQYVPYSVDEATGEPVSIRTPQGTVPTVPMSTQVTLGGQIVTLPTKGVPGTPTPATDTGLQAMPTAAEAGQVGTTENALTMGNRMLELINMKDKDGKPKVQPGFFAGRVTRAKATTGVRLSDEEAEMASLEENLSNALLEAMRGAQVGPQEQIKFEKSLPRLNQPEAVFRQNIRTTMANVARLNKRNASLRPVPDVSDNQPAAQSVPKTEQKPVVEEWVRGPDGKLRRKQ